MPEKSVTFGETTFLDTRDSSWNSNKVMARLHYRLTAPLATYWPDGKIGQYPLLPAQYVYYLEHTHFIFTFQLPNSKFERNVTPGMYQPQEPPIISLF